MPDQTDYGTSNSETTLVPQSLTVYRHFLVDTFNNIILRMGAIGSPSDRYRRAMRKDYHPGVEVHEARCSVGARRYIQEAKHSTPAPQVNCHCGFYAHYDPATDFYRSIWWGRDYGKHFLADEEWGNDLVIVRAACEVQGKVIMGRLGVRAEKMRITGMAVDWAKHMWCNGEKPVPRAVDYDFWGSPRPSSGVSYYRFHDPWDMDWREGKPPRGRIRAEDVWNYRDMSPQFTVKSEAEVIEDKVSHVAGRYGVKLWDSPDEMYAAHPKPDLSALGIEPEAPRTVDVSGLVASIKDASKALQTAMTQLQGASFTFSISTNTPIPFLDEPKKVSLVKAPKPTAMQRAIEAKKNRPAPPGTGIDRRKRKL